MKWELLHVGRPGRAGCCRTWRRAGGLDGGVGFLWESFQAELLNSDAIGCCPAQWARELANMERSQGCCSLDQCSCCPKTLEHSVVIKDILRLSSKVYANKGTHYSKSLNWKLQTNFLAKPRREDRSAVAFLTETATEIIPSRSRGGKEENRDHEGNPGKTKNTFWIQNQMFREWIKSISKATC